MVLIKKRPLLTIFSLLIGSGLKAEEAPKNLRHENVLQALGNYQKAAEIFHRSGAIEKTIDALLGDFYNEEDASYLKKQLIEYGLATSEQLKIEKTVLKVKRKTTDYVFNLENFYDKRIEVNGHEISFEIDLDKESLEENYKTISSTVTQQLSQIQKNKFYSFIENILDIFAVPQAEAFGGTWLSGLFQGSGAALTASGRRTWYTSNGRPLRIDPSVGSGTGHPGSPGPYKSEEELAEITRQLNNRPGIHDNAVRPKQCTQTVMGPSGPRAIRVPCSQN